LLEKTYGWQGALAEPARAWHDALRANRNCYISNKCVYRTDGARILFRETDIRELSTLEELKDLDFHAPARDTGAQYEVETISLSNFLKEARAPKEIDYLSIDVEGAELDILKSFDFDEYNIKLITIEHNFADQRQEICDVLERFGYRRKFVQISMFDDWYVRPDLLVPGRG
jgi:FkbM family methyltransferase